MGHLEDSPRARCSSPISVSIFRLRFLTEAHARSKNGRPPHSTTGAASASSTQFSHAALCGNVGSMAAMASRNSGSVSATHSRNRRLMSSSSGFDSGVSALNVIGCSAIPQNGHDPGPF